MFSRRTAAAVLGLCALAACGKKGPPLPPLHIVPDAVSEVSLRRIGDDVQIRFLLPSKNVNGPNPVNLDRIEVYATTVAAGAAAPPNREFLSAKFRVATIPARPPQVEGAPAPATPDTRPGPGEVARFTETLDEAKLRPVFTTPITAPSAAGTASASAKASASAAGVASASAGGATADKPIAAGAPPSAPVPTRIYAVRGVARNGRMGPPSTRLTLPLVDAPPAPSSVQVTFTATDVSLTWLPPVVADPTAKPPVFNVYGTDPQVPLNPAPLPSPTYQQPGVEFGKEVCFVVRSVVRTGAVSLESAASQPACVTPADVFPPSAPSGFSAVSAEGVVNLIWEASPEPDVAGYIVLRAEAPGDTLSPITKEPVQGTTYRDTAVTVGVRYVYAVVAVDKATPPNTSPQSRRIEETVR
jgi:predicted small lipoprotein YifL